MLKIIRKTASAAAIAGLSLLLVAGTSSAAQVDLIWIGTWDSTGAGNPVGVGGPGLTSGQKYVVKISYDDNSATATADVLTEFFTDSGQDMTTVALTGGTNTLDIFVPMEGLDSGGMPFIYNQNESDHFPAFTPDPTLNFALGSDISDTSNIVGLEFEGDFVSGGLSNIIELYNTAADAGSPINLVSQVLNYGTGIAATENNGLVEAVAVVANDTTVTYSAGDLLKTTGLAVTGNDLGANRSDGETFLDGSWSVAGTTQANGYDIAVAIQDSGLTNTTDSTTWSVTVNEQMTGLSDAAQAVVNYANASPTANLSASTNATGYEFDLTFDDLDLVVNALIAGFEMVAAVAAMVDGAATTFFDMLLNTGSQAATNSQLLAAFGIGTHQLAVDVQDLAGAVTRAVVNFTVEDNGPPPGVPVPPTLLLMLVGLGLLGFRRSGLR